MSIEKTPINFDDLTSKVLKEQKALINGIDINQVEDFSSFFKYFKLEILTYIVFGFIFLSCLFFREGPVFPFKELNYFNLLIFFLIYLRHTFIFTLFQQKDEEYRKTYEKVTGEKLDKTNQIEKRFGTFGLFLYLLFTAIPFIILYATSYF